MSIYNRNSLHGNLRLLAEQRILDRLSAHDKKLISIIRPTKIVNLNNSIIKWYDYKKNNGHFENFFQPLLFSRTANFIFNVAKKKYNKIYNLIGKKKIFFFRRKSKHFQKLKKYIINKKIRYKNNFKIAKPNLIKIIENKEIKEFLFRNTNE